MEKYSRDIFDEQDVFSTWFLDPDNGLVRINLGA